MLYTRAAIEQTGGGSDSLLLSIAEGDVRVAMSVHQEARHAAELALDQVLADSFPASDPPSWTLGVARPASFEKAEPTDRTAMEKQ